MTKAVLQNITGYYTLFKRLRRLIISAYCFDENKKAIILSKLWALFSERFKT